MPFIILDSVDRGISHKEASASTIKVWLIYISMATQHTLIMTEDALFFMISSRTSMEILTTSVSSNRAKGSGVSLVTGGDRMVKSDSKVCFGSPPAGFFLSSQWAKILENSIESIFSNGMDVIAAKISCRIDDSIKRQNDQLPVRVQKGCCSSNILANRRLRLNLGKNHFDATMASKNSRQKGGHLFNCNADWQVKRGSLIAISANRYRIKVKSIISMRIHGNLE